MASSVGEREFTVELVISTNHYEVEVEDVITSD